MDPINVTSFSSVVMDKDGTYKEKDDQDNIEIVTPNALNVLKW